MSSFSQLSVKLGLIILWCVTLFTPLVIGPTSLTYSSGDGWTIELMYMFIFGMYFPSGGGGQSGWFINPLYIPYVFMFLTFFIIYPVLVTKYCLNPTNQRGAIISGIISLAISLFAAGVSLPLEARLAGVYTGPLPFQFIIGLIVMQIVKRGITPPKDELLDTKPSWWKESQSEPIEDKHETD